MKKTLLSKSKLLSGAQCSKRLFLEVHRPDLLEYDAATLQKFSIGHRVGEVARAQWPQGVLVRHDDDLGAALKETKNLVEKKTPVLFESTFEAEGVLVRNDILVRNGKSVRLVEVKASTSVKDYHVLDTAIQTWVLRQAGVPLGDVEIAHINNQFVYQGGGDYEGLFTRVDMRKPIEPFLPAIPDLVARMRATLLGEEPDIAVGDHCHAPFECPFLSYCTPPQPDYPVTLLPRGGKAAARLLAEGYADLRDVPPGQLTSKVHERVWRITRSGKPELLPGAAKVLGSLPYPRYFLDFETVQYPVPIWEGTRPYEQLPFQWSCHIEHPDGTLEHRSFLDLTGNDPMRGFVESLLRTIGPVGPILVYNASFETGVLQSMCRHFPSRARELEGLIRRVVDLLPLTRDHYYHPDMKGSWSIKAVLPTVSPELSYDSLGEVSDSATAPIAYLEATDPGTSPERREALKTGLLNYCERDTFALVELSHFMSKQ